MAKVNRLTKTEGGEKLKKEIEIPRVAQPHNLHLLPSRKPYTLLEHFDKTGEDRLHGFKNFTSARCP